MAAWIPGPYFPGVPGLGDLTMDHVILDRDHPLLFVCRDESGDLFLCDRCDTRGEQRWVIARISGQSLLALLTNKLGIRAAFEQASGTCCIAVWSRDDPRERYTLLPAGGSSPEDLPEAGAFLDAEEGEHTDYIRSLADRSARAGSDP